MRDRMASRWRGRHLPFFHQARQVRRHHRLPAFRQIAAGIDQQHLDPVRGGKLGDAAPHLSGTDDAQPLHGRIVPGLLLRQGVKRSRAFHGQSNPFAASDAKRRHAALAAAIL